MDNFQSITASPEALAAFLGSYPGNRNAVGRGFSPALLLLVLGGGLHDCRRSERDNPLCGLSSPLLAAEVEK